jgi:predicted GIY-YIG superfamily endonuclease
MKSTQLDDYISRYNEILNKANTLLNDPKRKTMAMYIIVSLSTGLKATDILTITWEQLREKYTEVNGKKVMFNSNVMRTLDMIDNGETGPIFISQKRTVFSKEHINRSLKKYIGNNVTTHTLRKVFGLEYLNRHHDKDSAISHLSKHYNHNSINMTKTYLDIQDKTLDEWDVYNVVDSKEKEYYNIEEYKDIIPSKTKGIYFLYNKDKTIVYIGKSVLCIRQRINEHYEQNPSRYLSEKQVEDLLNKRETYKYFSYIPMEEKDKVDSKEAQYITEYKPLYNKEFLYND